MREMANLKIEIHLLQNFPPSCLNRDDTNTPKTCEFGGVTRARVSSQCWKRAVREHFRENAPERRGVRSKRLKAELVSALAEAGLGTPETLGAPVERFVTTFYAGMEKNQKRKDETNVLVFWSQAEFAKMVEVLSRPEVLEGLRSEEPLPGKGNIERELKGTQRTADVALFARMLADKPDLNIDAACQVAHAISTHGVDLELDFYTAVDDLKDIKEMDDAGAGMLGTVGYDSACYYRYALVDFAQLVANLNGDAGSALASLDSFVRGFIEAVPSARQNSFAHGTQPFLALAVVRRGGTPCSLVNAFAKPVKSSDNDILGVSAVALARHAGRLGECYDLYDTAEPFYYQTIDADLAGIPGTRVTRMRELVRRTCDATKALWEGEA
jgi:CRISPR system Cascade subunit CasC